MWHFIRIFPGDQQGQTRCFQFHFVYNINDLLSNANFGCFVGNYSYTVLQAYADEVALIAPTISAMRICKMLSDNYALDFHVFQ